MATLCVCPRPATQPPPASISFLRFYLFLFRQRRGREKERERNISVWLPLTHPLLGTWPATKALALTGNRTSDLLVPRLALNPLSHTSQGPLLRFTFFNFQKAYSKFKIVSCHVGHCSMTSPSPAPELPLASTLPGTVPVSSRV